MFLGFVELDAVFTRRTLVLNAALTPTNADALPTYRIFSKDGIVLDGTVSLGSTGAVSNATNASPVEITSTSHGLTTGAYVTVAGVGGNTDANGSFSITKVNNNKFTLDDATGNGPYTSGGVWNEAGLYEVSLTASGTNGFERGEHYQILYSYDIATVAQGKLDTFGVG